LSLARHDLDAGAVGILERQCPGLGSRLAATGQPGADGQADGVQSPHPVATGGEAVDNSPGGVRQLHPEPGTGCNQRADGVQPGQPQGAVAAPEPSKEPCIKPSAAPARVDEAPALDGQDGGPVGEFFTALGPGWRLTAAQQTRLAPAVTAALDAGWTPLTLAAIAGANTSGVRSPYAVLAARLAPAELPLPHTQRPSRSPWCGQCDERTRMLGFDDDAPRPCPRCKPAATASRASPATPLACTRTSSSAPSLYRGHRV
jgi:hypothetical protein